MLRVVVAGNECERIHSETEVKTEVKAVKIPNEFIAHPHVADVLKHSPTRACDLAEVLMLIGAFILLLEPFRIIKEPFAEPFPRHAEIGGVMHEPVGILKELFLIHPVVLTFGRVEGAELPVFRTAAQERLIEVADFLHAAELVKLLEPHNADVAKRQLDGLDLLRIVNAEKEDFLTGLPVGNLMRACLETEFTRESQRVDTPLHLRVNTCLDCVTDFAQDDRMAVWILDEELRDLEAYL